MVSDIGCSGLFDTFFHTHAFHGLHGRALTYATGIKMARPELNVVVTMGDGGLGIGGAHLLSACRRNLDITLLVLNNFNYGMTGGQCSSTTPQDAVVGSAFLNRLEFPLDVCRVAASAGAPYARRCTAYTKDLAREIETAVRYQGFSILDIWGICPGRYTKKNRLTPRIIEERMGALPDLTGLLKENQRKEYALHYSELAGKAPPPPPPLKIGKQFDPPQPERQEVIILGGAGQRVITAGELLCLAGMTAGLCTTQKNEYNITVLRGPSISELILSPAEIGYTGIQKPDVVLAIHEEGITKRKAIFEGLDPETLVILPDRIKIPPCEGSIRKVDFSAQKIKDHDRALAGLAVLAKMNRVLSVDMLVAALSYRFKETVLKTALELVDRVEID
jgi:Pyruvate/2-oxoacid:ferredoxin oxidoreductase gamma subunit